VVGRHWAGDLVKPVEQGDTGIKGEDQHRNHKIAKLDFATIAPLMVPCRFRSCADLSKLLVLTKRKAVSGRMETA